MQQLFEVRQVVRNKTFEQFEELMAKKSDQYAADVYQSITKFIFDSYKPSQFLDYCEVMRKYQQKAIEDSIARPTEQQTKATILMKLCQIGSVDNIRKVMNWGTSFQACDSRQRNCIFYALQNRDQGLPILELIIQRFPMLLEKSIDDEGMTLLHLSLLKKNLRAAIMLLKKEQVRLAMATLPSKKQETPMHLLLKQKSRKEDRKLVFEIFQLLLESGADPYKKDAQFKTALDYCSEEFRKQLICIINSQSKNAVNKVHPDEKEKRKTKSQVGGRDILRQNNQLIRANVYSKSPPLFHLHNEEDNKIVIKEAEQIFEERVKVKEEMVKINKFRANKQRKEERSRVIPSSELRYYLQEDILLETSIIQGINQENQKLYERLIDSVRLRLTQQLPIKVDVFGSFATQLCLPESDIDIVIAPLGGDIDPPFILLEKVYNILLEMNEEIKSARFIKTASVPIIKMECTQAYNEKKMDITIQDENHNGLRAVELIRHYLKTYDHLKPLVFILKKYVYSSKLFDPYQGGISSYGLILMIVAFIQQETFRRKDKLMTSELLIGFLRFYGYQTDYIHKCICVYEQEQINNGGYTGCVHPYIRQEGYDLTPKLVIIDPLNSGNNVGRSTYKIKQIKMAAEVAYMGIHANLICGKKKTCPSYQRIKKCKVDLKNSEKPRPCCILKRMFKCCQAFLRHQS